jgi:hypothetical protein
MDESPEYKFADYKSVGRTVIFLPAGHNLNPVDQLRLLTGRTMMSHTEDDARRKALNDHILETPCPRCEGPLELSEHTIGTYFMLPGPQGAWDFCNRHTFPYCAKCGSIPFAEVIPRPE